MNAQSVIQYAHAGALYSFTPDAWFNATEAAGRFGKEVTAWLRQRETAEYIATLAEHLQQQAQVPDSGSLPPKSNSGFLPEFNEINKLNGTSAQSRRLLLALVKKTGLVRTKSGAPENGGGFTGCID